MIPYNVSPSLLQAPMPELLEKLYSVGCVGTLYRDYLLPSRKNPGDIEKAKKSVMVAALVAMENDQPLLKAFCERMPPPLQKAIQILAWVESCLLVELEKEIGAEIVQITKGTPRPAGDYRNPDHKIEQVELFDLIVIGSMPQYWGYQEVTKSHATASLPRALRRFFKRGVPAPAHSGIIALEEWSGEGADTRIYNGAEFLAADLRGLGDGFRRGSIKRNKDGSLAKSCLRDFQKLVPGGEFFPPTDGAPDDLDRVRLQLLVEFFNRKGKPLLPPESLTASSLAGFLRDVSKQLADSHAFVLDQILSHLRPDSPGANPEFLTGPFSRLLALFSELPDGRWVSAKNLLDFRLYREIDLKFFAVSRYSARRAREDVQSAQRYAYYIDRTRLSRDNAPDLLLAPMICGMAFFLAALGFLDVCYDRPYGHSKWRIDGKHYLTPFDGLEAVRLAPAGAFAFGLRNDLPLTVREQPKCEVRLHPERLLARATLLDPLTEKVLCEFMHELEPGFYRLDRKRFLAGCSGPKKIRERVEDFKRRLPAELPPFWENFLDGLTLEGLSLRSELNYTVYSLGDSAELAHLFSTDPELRGSCLRVEGRRVAIPDADFPNVRKRLLKAGFFV